LKLSERHITTNTKIIRQPTYTVFILIALLFAVLRANAQEVVLTNHGAAVTLTNGVVIGTWHTVNRSGGNIINNGTLNMTGNFTSTATTSGNGLFTLGGNWTNSGGIFLPGTSTVIFNGAVSQKITRAGGEGFYNLSVINPGIDPLNRVEIETGVTVSGVLTMTIGNIDAGPWVLYLANPAAASLNYNSSTKSRILGKFERGINQTENYLFPLGTPLWYNPANLRPNSINSSGTILSEFLTAPPPGNAGLPKPDPPVEIADVFPSGYWNMTSFGFSTGNFNINLNGTGFTDTVRVATRVVKRTAGADWMVDGAHLTADTAGNVVYRNNLLTDISPSGTQFAIGRARPLILDHPHDTAFCERTNPVFTVIASGTPALRYAWYKVSSPADILIENGAHYSGARTPTLTIIGAELSDAGEYYCIVRDRNGNATRTNNATLVVFKIPVATVSDRGQDHVCSNIDFIDMVLGLTYWDPGTRFVWTRDNPAGITSALPMSDTKYNIGDLIEGVFTNSTDSVIKVTFLVTPIGPAYTECVGDPVEAYLMINPTPRIIPVNVKPAICFGEDTEIILTSPTQMTKGVITFDYTISVSGVPGDVTGTITGGASGMGKSSTINYSYENHSDTIQSVYYSILPRNIESGCYDGVIEIPEVKLHPEPLRNLSISIPLTCSGGSDASLTAILSRGSKPDNVNWVGPFGYQNSYTTNSNVTTISGVRTGWFYLNVIDNLGCTNGGSVLVSGAQLNSILYVAEKVNGYGTTCPESTDGVIGVKENPGSTGIPPFEYWIQHVEADTMVRHGIINAINEPLDYTYNLAPGTYRLLIYDNNGCVNTNYPITSIMAPDEITVEFLKDEYAGGFNVTCLGYNDGSVRINTIYGGSGGYTYKWTTVNGSFSGPDNLDHLDNITAGTYYFTITDMLGCVKVDSVTLTQPDGMVLSGSQISSSPDGDFNISCNGGNDGFIKLNITGGSGTYNFAWTGPAGFTATTRDISGLKAGTYTCLINDVNGCTMTPNPQFTLTEPDALSISSVSSLYAGPVNIRCFGETGSIDITVTGGSTGNYFFEWSTINGSGIVSGQEDQMALTAGNYHLVVRDSNNCVAVHDVTLAQPDALVTTLTPTHITCAAPGLSNGTVTLAVSGGVAPYSYSWSNGAITQNISGLPAGKYIVTVTDINGCQKTDSVTINLPPPIEYTKTISDFNGFNISCYGLANGNITINTISGQAPYIYSWSGPNGFTASTGSISGLRAGQYTLTITDANMCTATEVIEVSQPGRLSMVISLSSSIAGGYNINCAGDSTAQIGIEPVNQAGSVTYLWSDGNSSRARYDLPAGIYDLIITDANNCHADTTIILSQPDSLRIDFTVNQPWCPDKPDGSVSAIVTGGVVGVDYNYKWSDNSTGHGITNILRGYYKLTVTDLNHCVVRDSVKIEPLNETCLIIPNAISPNDDLVNDVWNIGEKELYPQMEIRIFNRWGETLWRSERGYPTPWDGRSNGKPLPVDSYHYIIDLKNGSKPYVGNITIVR
jgi:gliding motility-associated-like protein